MPPDSDIENMPVELQFKAFDGMRPKDLARLRATSKTLNATVLEYVQYLVDTKKLRYTKPPMKGWDPKGSHGHKNNPVVVLKDWGKGFIERGRPSG